MNKKLLIGLFFILMIFLTACGPKESIKIGFAGNMTMFASDLGIDGRNGATLRIEEYNEKGGFKGRMIELVVKDDRGDTKTAEEIHKEFQEEGIELIMGHLISKMSDPVQKAQGENMLFFSPSMSSSVLDDIDDYIVRSAPNADGQAAAILADMQEKNFKTYYIVFDQRNAQYTESLRDYFLEHSAEFDVTILDIAGISEVAFSYEQVAQDIIDTHPDCVVLLMNSIDTALTAQHLRNKSMDKQVYTATWAMTGDLIENGGKSVEGLRLTGLYFPETPSETYLEYQEAFRNRFGYEPTFMSELAYDAAGILLEVIEETGTTDPKTIKEALMDYEYEGLRETFRINSLGDANRKSLIYQIENGEFVPEWK